MIKDTYIKRAIYAGNFVIVIETEEGEMRSIDFKPMLNGNMGDFTSLRNENNFKNFYLNEVGILTWDVDLPITNPNQINQYDIAPEYITEHSMPLVYHQGEYRIIVGQTA
jgi:hypothetical protein